MKILLHRFKTFHSNEQGATLVESVAWTAAIAVMLWAIYAVLLAGAPQMVGAWTNAGINQRDLWEGRGNMPNGWPNPPPIGNPNYNGGNGGATSGGTNSATEGGGWFSNLGNWLKGRIQDLTQFVLKDLPDALKNAAENTKILITRIEQTLEINSDAGQLFERLSISIAQAVESPKTWQGVFEDFIKDLGRAAGWTVGLTVAIDVLDKLLRGQGKDIFTGDFGLHLLVDIGQNLLVGAAAVGITAAIVAAAPIEIGAVGVALITLGAAVILGSIVDLSGVGDKFENWIKSWFGGGTKPEPAPAS